MSELPEDFDIVDGEKIRNSRGGKPRANIDELRKILSYMSKGYKVPKIVYDVIFDIAKREVEEKNKVVLIKRDPNVHKARIQAAYAKIIEGETININPTHVGGFGADFDGDSVFCYIKIYRKDKNDNFNEEIVHIANLVPDHCKHKLESKKNKDGVLVYNYKVLDNIYVRAIDVETGQIDYKKVTHWSMHENINMYDIASDECELDIAQLVVGEDHSLVVYDLEDDIFKKATPFMIEENPERYCLVKEKT